MVEPIARDTTSTPPADHPYFVSTIKPYCLNMPHLYLPLEFARSNGLFSAEKREMILRDDKERSWPVVLGRMGHHVGLLRGWQAFQMAKGLKEGDAYKFELIKNGKKPIAKFYCKCRFSSIILAVLKAKTCVFLAHIAMGANGNCSRSLFWRRRLKEAVAGMF
nr:B3 domain-containing protein REM10-like [Ipomoea batatas]